MVKQLGSRYNKANTGTATVTAVLKEAFSGKEVSDTYAQNNLVTMAAEDKRNTIK